MHSHTRRLKRYGLIYIHQDGKKKYSILSPSEKNITKESSQAINLTPRATNGGSDKEKPVEHFEMEQRSVPVSNKE